jgi:hypothetical protein
MIKEFIVEKSGLKSWGVEAQGENRRVEMFCNLPIPFSITCFSSDEILGCTAGEEWTNNAQKAQNTTPQMAKK